MELINAHLLLAVDLYRYKNVFFTFCGSVSVWAIVGAYAVYHIIYAHTKGGSFHGPLRDPDLVFLLDKILVPLHEQF